MASPDPQQQRPYQAPDDPFGGFFKGIGEFFDALSEALAPDETPFSAGERKRAVAPTLPSQHAQHGLTADIFDEERDLLVVVELPGVPHDGLHISAEGDILAIDVVGDPTRSLELLLPCTVRADSLVWRYHNGILEARAEKSMP